MDWQQYESGPKTGAAKVLKVAWVASVSLALHLHAGEASLATWLRVRRTTRIPKGLAVTFRIYADFNGLHKAADGKSLVIELDAFDTLRDLSNAGVRLEDGFALTAT